MAVNKKDRQRGIPAEELSSFCTQVALMLQAGIPLRDGLEMLVEDAGEDSAYASALRGVEETGSLADALREDERWPRYLAEMVNVGETTGRLEDVLLNLSDYYEREGRIRSALISAVTYPLVLSAMLVVIILVLLWQVLPVFRRVLSGFGVGMAESGATLMNLGAVLGWVALCVIAVCVIGVLVCVALLRTRHRQKVLDVVQRVFPPLRSINRKLSAARVASMMSMMLSSGYPMDSALEMAPHILSDEDAIRRVKLLSERLAAGETFAAALEEAGLFESFHNRMIRVGAASGQEPQVMAKIAGIYEEQVETGLTRLVSMIEPVLVAVLSVVIGAILLAVMLPMAGVLASM